MNMFAVRHDILVVTVVTFMHWLPAFSIPYRMISGRRCCCSALYLSTYERPASLGRVYQCDACAAWCCSGPTTVSIAGVYSPRRAARLHLAR